MKKYLTVVGLVIMVSVLVFLALPLGAAPASDCNAFDTGGFAPLGSVSIPFSCAADATVYFGVCDSGSVPNDDLFNIDHTGTIVAYNYYVGAEEYAVIQSQNLTAGDYTVIMNSLNVGVGQATYSYGISTDKSEITGYLSQVCGTDFGGTTPPATCSYGPRDVPVFTEDTAPTNGTLEFRIMLGNEDSREEAGLMKTWNLSAGQRVNNEIVPDPVNPRWARLWWQPEGDSSWYLLPSQYWHGDGTLDSEYGIECEESPQPSYHTSFETAVPEADVCFDLLNGC
ncbi:MAG: hypothetical protein KDE48_10840 [Anaerolineales bacterium]|nr:hypothetical protein [Anaerolineales bacterium]